MFSNCKDKENLLFLYKEGTHKIMIDYIKGKIVSLTPTEVVVETGNIGYIALISLQTYSALEGKSEGKVFIHHILREDEELFYGFAEAQERDIFRMLTSVSGIGAATARMMLSSLTCDEIRTAIIGEDVRKIQSVKGIGLKSAQRMIIELKDKISKSGAGADSSAIFSRQSTVGDEAATALQMLGFAKGAVCKAVDSILKTDPTAPVESVIKQALKTL